MEGEESHGDLLELGSVPVVVYMAMLGATIAGQLAGIAIDALLGSRGMWIPALCSVSLEAVVGARFGAVRTGHSLSVAQSARLSAYYSLGLACLSVPLGAWILAARPPAGAALLAWTGPELAAAGAAVALATAVRWALMVLLAPRSR